MTVNKTDTTHDCLLQHVNRIGKNSMPEHTLKLGHVVNPEINFGVTTGLCCCTGRANLLTYITAGSYKVL